MECPTSPRASGCAAVASSPLKNLLTVSSVRNRGGAFKQTSDGRWAHVVCAIWIPEVCFANTVFLEPVEGVSNIPPARWKLTCYLCKQRGRGASIQCHKANCYTAFHVTCAQRAGLFMKIDPVRETNVNGTTFSVKKTAFCEAHSPPGQETVSDEESEGRVVGSRGRASRGRSAYTEGPITPKKSRKTDDDAKTDKKKGKKSTESTGQHTASPQVTVPQIPTTRLNIICKGILFQRKTQFMQRLHSYWLLKRQSRNGVPLVRRLHLNVQTQRNTEQPEVDEKVSAAREALRYWQKLRHDLEKARLLVELIRKREKLQTRTGNVKVHQAALEMQLTPMLVLLRSTLEQLQEKDTAQIFAQPVNIKEVPDYLEFISQPMDFSTMVSKLESHTYHSVADLEADFSLMVSNCLLYNGKDTVFHRAALRLRDLGGAILRHAQRQATNTGLDLDSGMLLPESPQKRDFYSCTWEDDSVGSCGKLNYSKLSQFSDTSIKPIFACGLSLSCCAQFDSVLDPDNRLHMSVEEQLKELLEKLDFVTSMRCSGARTRRIRLLRREINNIRYRQGQHPRHSLHNGHLKDDEDDDDEDAEEDDDKEAKADNGLSSSDKEDLKSTSPPTLEPTGPAPPPRQGDAPLEPPTLRPITGEPQSPRWPCKRLKLDSDLPDSTAENINCTKAQERPASQPPILHSEGQAVTNGLPELSTPPAAHHRGGLTNGFNKHKDGRVRLRVQPVSSPPQRNAMAAKLSEDETELEPLELVWAKCRGYPSYPALIIDPEMPEEGLLHNGVPIPVPPKDVLHLGEQRQEEANERLYLVLFFDNKRTWQWLPRNKLTPLGVDDTADKLRIIGGPQVQHPQVCPGGVRPRHDPPEQSQPQPRLCSLQLPVEGNGEPCVHPQTATMHFSLVLKQQVGRSPCCQSNLYSHCGLKRLLWQHRALDCSSLQNH
ncbi:Bromodomain and PHD finger-containing protein 3 [Larimichthys crocea]|uniref:Uncharacterized protein n=1 Tax=Larimichthys crocea TaxID=215358 RepID=A0ACD3RA27_LARCR|nr:Bromodomain and PHD finger-containing protein 3 [Larimichthys crocea]